MKYEIEIDEKLIPEGYIPDGFRTPLDGEKAIDYEGDTITPQGNSNAFFLVLKKDPAFIDWDEVPEGSIIELTEKSSGLKDLIFFHKTFHSDSKRISYMHGEKHSSLKWDDYLFRIVELAKPKEEKL